MQSRDYGIDVFGVEYVVGNIVAYAKHNGVMFIGRVVKLGTKNNTLSAMEISRCDDGLWRENQTGRATILMYPAQGMIIESETFPYTDVPEVKPKPKLQRWVPHHDPYEDDEDDD